MSKSTPVAILAVLGAVIPLGLMLAPLTIGAIVLVLALGRIPRAVGPGGSIRVGVGMSDLLVLVVVVAFPATVLLGFLGLLTLGVAAVSDLDGTGLVRAASGPRDGSAQPAPGSPSGELSAEASVTSGPAARMASVTPSA